MKAFHSLASATSLLLALSLGTLAQDNPVDITAGPTREQAATTLTIPATTDAGEALMIDDPILPTIAPEPEGRSLVVQYEIHGKVAFIDVEDIYINIGDRDGVLIGDKFLLGKLVQGNADVQQNILPVAKADVVRIVSPSLSIVHVTAKVPDLAVEPGNIVYLATTPAAPPVAPELLAAMRQLILTDRAIQDSLRGQVGQRGPQGLPGIDGATTAQYTPGPQGPMGPIGPIGPQGPAGWDGIAGPQGPRGERGEMGPRGYNGSTGPMGPRGFDGRGLTTHQTEMLDSLDAFLRKNTSLASIQAENDALNKRMAVLEKRLDDMQKKLDALAKLGPIATPTEPGDGKNTDHPGGGKSTAPTGN